jgi:3-oxoacyl-[acyl-carrier protein] reductase
MHLSLSFMGNRASSELPFPTMESTRNMATCTAADAFDSHVAMGGDPTEFAASTFDDETALNTSEEDSHLAMGGDPAAFDAPSEDYDFAERASEYDSHFAMAGEDNVVEDGIDGGCEEESNAAMQGSPLAEDDATPMNADVGHHCTEEDSHLAMTGVADTVIASEAPIITNSSQYLPFAGKVALVTGSSRGIGRGIVLELAQRGASVVVNYSSSADAAESVVHEVLALNNGASAIALRGDVSNPAEIAQLFEQAIQHFSHLDIVVSNAGTEIWKDELEVTQEDFDRIFSINCRGQFFVAQQGMKYLPRGGRIVLMSSIAATAFHVPNHALHAGSKAAVEGITRAMAIDCGPRGITCNAIAPGGIKTEMLDTNAWHCAPGGTPDMDIEKIDAGIAAACPLRRVGRPADIGRAVSLLVSPESEWINGQVVHINGGSI